MPNIGHELEERLTRVGILSPSQLQEMGSIKAFQLLHAADPDACINMLYALEGAVQNIRWHNLTKSTKQELLFYFKEIKQSGENTIIGN